MSTIHPASKTLESILDSLNIRCAEVRFEGSGDSGGLESIYYMDNEGEAFSPFSDSPENKTQQVRLEHVLEEIGYTLITEYARGFEINEGGNVGIAFAKRASEEQEEEQTWGVNMEIVRNLEDSFNTHYTGDCDDSKKMKDWFRAELSTLSDKINGIKESDTVEYKMMYSGAGDSGGVIDRTIVFNGKTLNENEHTALYREWGTIAEEFPNTFFPGYEVNDGGYGNVSVTFKDGDILDMTVDECSVVVDQDFEDFALSDDEVSIIFKTPLNLDDEKVLNKNLEDMLEQIYDVFEQRKANAMR